MSEIRRHQLSNGLCLVAEPIDGVRSLAMSFLLPAGVAQEPPDQQGVAALLAEMICRGAGTRDARAHSDALDQLGVQRSTGVETHHLHLGATLIGAKLREALPLLLDMVRAPLLTEEALEPARDLALQSIAALEDEPQQKTFVLLRERHYPAPFGRSPLGRKEYLQTITPAQLRAYWREAFVPGRAVLGFAGAFDWAELRDMVERALGDWQGTATEPVEIAPAPRQAFHENAPSTQVHIGLAYEALPEPHPDSILEKSAVAVLSGGMSGRLFTEVREKRGLCYSVGARYAGDKRRGTVLAYAGTTAPRAQETLDVLAGELRRLGQGIGEDEFARAMVGMKAGVVMQGESTGARAASITADQYIYGRPRTLEELAALVDAVKLDRLRQFVAAHVPGAMTLVTVGPEALRLA